MISGRYTVACICRHVVADLDNSLAISVGSSVLLAGAYYPCRCCTKSIARDITRHAHLLQLLQRYLNSPLNGIPGPWWARLSAIPLFYKSAVCRQQAQTIEDLHKQYGPIVRIAPGEVAVSSQASFKAVHKIGSGFTKSVWYGFIGPTEKNYGPAGMFQELDPHRHAQTRKMFSRGFSAANLRVEWEDMVRSKVVKAVKGIAAEADRANGLADVRRWWTLMASDVVSEVAFGEALGGLDTQEVQLSSDPWTI